MIDDRSSAFSPETIAADAVALWQGQPTTGFRLSPAAVAAAEHEYVRLRRGTMTKSVVMLIFLVAALVFAIKVDVTLIRIGCLAAAVAYARVLYTLQRKGRSDAEGAAAERKGAGVTAPSFVHYRAALVRERDRLTGWQLWLPFAVAVPAGLILLLGIAQARPALQRYVWVELAMFAVAMPVALFIGRRRARQFQARLDDLDALISDR